MSRSMLRQFGRWVIAALLLAQLAIAAHACPSLVGSADPAVTAAAVLDEIGARPTIDMVAESDGCGDATGIGDPDAPNLCAEHCKFGDQADHSANIVVSAPLPSLLYIHLPDGDPTSAGCRSAASLSELVAATPPHAILHCVRRT